MILSAQQLRCSTRLPFLSIIDLSFKSLLTNVKVELSAYLEV